MKCNCTQKGGEKTINNPNFYLKMKKTFFYSHLLCCRCGDRGSRSDPPANNDFRDTLVHNENYRSIKSTFQMKHTPSLSIQTPLRTPNLSSTCTKSSSTAPALKDASGTGLLPHNFYFLLRTAVHY